MTNDESEKTGRAWRPRRADTTHEGENVNDQPMTNAETQMTKTRQIPSPNGATDTSPGHRPGAAHPASDQKSFLAPPSGMVLSPHHIPVSQDAACMNLPGSTERCAPLVFHKATQFGHPSPNEATVFSPNGAKYVSPGQRPGLRHVIISSPEGATHLRQANPRHGSPLQGSGSFPSRFLGRRPRLAWTGPLALNNRNIKTEVVG